VIGAGFSTFMRAAEVATEEASEGRIFGLDAQLLFDILIQGIAVFLLFLFLSYILINPVRKMLEERQAKIQNDIASAAKDREDAAKLKEEYDEKIKTADAEASDILAEARRKAVKNEEADYVTHIGTFDGTGPMQTPVGDESSELTFIVSTPESAEYDVFVEYASGYEVGAGQWLQLAVGDGNDTCIFYDYLLPATKSTTEFTVSEPIKVKLNAGENVIRVMNHRRQENTLYSYATMLKELKKAAPDRDILLSLCEWGKNQPQNWAYKVGESWRILNDITFRVGHDGYPGDAAWYDDYTPSITSQYNKAVIMDEFAGLDKGWNDPDMLVVGMNGLTDNMNRTHMAMWCMLNSPLMLGIDFRRVKRGDAIYNIIANKNLIDLNQDKLGIQAKRVQCTVETEDGMKMIANPDTEYVRDKKRVDVLAKPLADGSIAVSFINISDNEWTEKVCIDVKAIVGSIGSKMCNKDAFANASSYKVTDLWTGGETICDGTLEIDSMEACGNVTVKVSPVA